MFGKAAVKCMLCGASGGLEKYFKVGRSLREHHSVVRCPPQQTDREGLSPLLEYL